MSAAGIVGVGAMGSAIARALLARGREVVACDPVPERVQAVVRAGASAAASPAEVAGRASCVLTSLPSVAALEEVTAGDAGLVAGEAPGVVVVETSTLPVAAKERARAQLSDFGTVLLDCPLSGTAAQARAGDVVVYASGDVEAFRSVRAVLADFARSVWFLGGFGAGTRLKLVANLLVAVHSAAAAEALVLARKSGLDAAQALEILCDSAATSRMLEIRGPAMVERTYDEAAMRTRLFRKDLDIITAHAAELDCPTPLLAVAEQLYSATLAGGGGERDLAAVVEVLERLAGLDRDD